MLIDIGHPAHVHYFKNAYKVLVGRGDEVLLIARDKDVTFELLNNYRIPYTSRGKGSSNLLGKVLLWPMVTGKVLRVAKSFEPDILLSFSSPYAAPVSRLLRKPHIAFDDTENARLNRLFYRPFTELVLSPDCYEGVIAANQECFNGFMELCYLHPNYFKPRPEVKRLLGVQPGEKYSVLRLVSWAATHDVRHEGLSAETITMAVEELSKFGQVFISSERELPEDLDNLRFRLSADWMHDAIYHAELVYGESATMASEAAMLGTPAIYLDSEGRGYTRQLEKDYGIVFNFTECEQDQIDSVEKAKSILQNGNSKAEFEMQHRQLLNDKVDVTEYLLGVIDRYSHNANGDAAQVT